MTTHTDNYDATLQALRSFIKHHLPPGCNLHDLHHLEPDYTSSFMSLRFVRLVEGSNKECECTLYVNMQPQDIVEDEHQNLWDRYNINVEVSWPSWGATESTLALKRLELMTEVAQFAQLISTTFQQEVWSLQYTKEKRDELVRAREAAQLQRQVTNTVNGMPERKGMRAGHKRYILLPDARFDGIPEGEYTTNMNDKTFKLTVYNAGAWLLRTT